MTNETLYFLLDTFIFNTIEGVICFCFYDKFYQLKTNKICILLNGFILGTLIFASSVISNGNLVVKQMFIMILYYFYFLLFTKCDKNSSLIFSFGFIGYVCAKEVVLFFLYYYIIGKISFCSSESFSIFIISKILDIVMLGVFNLKIFAGGITRR